PSRLALLVYDMQVGVLRQLPSPAELIERVREVLDAAREGGYRVVFTRHMSLPNELAGVAQLRTAMAWQRLDDVRDVRPWFLRDSPGFELIPEVTPRASEAIFDKISLSAFVGTPLEMALRDCGITALAIVGVALEVGVEPTVRHAADLGFIPVVATDACGGRDLEAGERSLAGLAFAGDAMFTDARTLGGLLRGVRRETAMTS
ncbi:MAG TPA: isochorismatase family cysteine hydrolase, partial [Gemmatimonadales bacterium]|nr:isochorismatase family cysteine hydrolase [Gemmatimonadales bacterium]